MNERMVSGLDEWANNLRGDAAHAALRYWASEEEQMTLVSHSP